MQCPAAGCIQVLLHMLHGRLHPHTHTHTQKHSCRLVSPSACLHIYRCLRGESNRLKTNIFFKCQNRYYSTDLCEGNLGDGRVSLKHHLANKIARSLAETDQQRRDHEWIVSIYMHTP